ncbi:MAG TPA: arginine deiminase family protein [Polyangiaceae bacterium]|nr:arginine deiminase family protein [Polyangiaceae bacterium]
MTSEIAALRGVLVHRPGDEVVRMTQHELVEALFDDILSPPEAAREHDLMVEILQGAGAETLELGELLTQALARAPKETCRHLVERSCIAAGVGELVDVIVDWPAERLASGLVSGIYWTDVGKEVVTLARLRAELGSQDPMAMRPLANLMFLRDPCMAIGDRVVVGQMARAARAREPSLVAFAIEHSGAFADPRFVQHDELEATLEGGDVLVVSPQLLVIGCSQRTAARSIERLACGSLFEALPHLERVYAVMMPDHRTVMHLDTILTQIDERLFLGHRPYIAGSQALPVARLERDRAPAIVRGATVLDVLREELGDDTTLVPCGGNVPLHQEREQWTDGANALCLAPGHIILYARNVHTIAALREHGFGETGLHMVQPPEQRRELIAEGMARPRNVFSFPGGELSRARGGGRCLTMPLCREP